MFALAWPLLAALILRWASFLGPLNPYRTKKKADR